MTRRPESVRADTSRMRGDCVSTADSRDLVIAALVDAEADLREQLGVLIDLIADLTFENAVLRTVFWRELVERIHGDAALGQLRRKLRERERKKKAAP